MEKTWVPQERIWGSGVMCAILPRGAQMEWLPPVTEARRRRSPRTDGFPQHLCVGMRWASPRGSESLSIYLLAGSRPGCSG